MPTRTTYVFVAPGEAGVLARTVAEILRIVEAYETVHSPSELSAAIRAEIHHCHAKLKELTA